MPLANDDVDALSRLLLDAESRHIPVEPISATHPGITAEDAYRIQEALVSLKIRQGDKLTGRKVGATSPPIQQVLRIDTPIYGHLFESSRVPDGSTIFLNELIHPRAECEIAFWLANDLEGPGVTEEDVLASTDAVSASLEINDPRTREWKVSQFEVIADNGLVARFVLSDLKVPAVGLDLSTLKAVLRRNGSEVATATGEAVLGHPARAVAWLANQLAERGQRILAGDLVLPGSLTPLAPVDPGDHIEAEFEALGRVSVIFA